MTVLELPKLLKNSKRNRLKHGQKPSKTSQQLRDFEKKSGLTQQELSESAEVSRKSINAIENGIYIPSTVPLKIARTLKCSVEDLFDLP